MEPYTSNSFDNSGYDPQSLPYVPYGTSNEDSTQQYNAEIGTNSNVIPQQLQQLHQPAPTFESPPVYEPYNQFPSPVFSSSTASPTAFPPSLSGTYSSVPTAPTQPRKKRRIWLYMLLIVLFFFVVAFSAYEITAYLNRSTPEKTLDTFCSAVQRGDYQTAYNQFTPNMQTNFTESQFAAILSSDSVAKCTHGSTSDSGATVSTHLSLYHSKSLKTNNDIVMVSKDTHSQWKISGLQSA